MTSIGSASSRTKEEHRAITPLINADIHTNRTKAPVWKSQACCHPPPSTLWATRGQRAFEKLWWSAALFLVPPVRQSYHPHDNPADSLTRTAYSHHCPLFPLLPRKSPVGKYTTTSDLWPQYRKQMVLLVSRLSFCFFTELWSVFKFHFIRVFYLPPTLDICFIF